MEKASIFLFPGLSLSVGFEEVLEERRRDMELDSSNMETYNDTILLLHHQNVDSIIRWGAAAKMLEQWEVLMMVILDPGIIHP